jgi:predicted DNA-binding transcriptional regulator YafY
MFRTGAMWSWVGQLTRLWRRSRERIDSVLATDSGREVALGPADVRRLPVAFDVVRLRAAIRARQKIRFCYHDENGAETRRKVRPLTLWFYPPKWLAGSWCELRDDFRFFRLDQMHEVEFLSESFCQRRASRQRTFSNSCSGNPEAKRKTLLKIRSGSRPRPPFLMILLTEPCQEPDPRSLQLKC